MSPDVDRLASGKYQARWRDDTGRQRKRSFRTKGQADDWLAEVRTDTRRGSFVDPALAKVTIGTWGEEWIARQAHLTEKSTESLLSLWRSRVKPRWDRVQLGRVRHDDVVQWVADLLKEGLSASRTRQSYHLLTGLLDDAVKAGRLPRNPAAGVDLPRLPPGRRMYLTHRQLAQLAAEAVHRAPGVGAEIDPVKDAPIHRTVVLVLGYCGLRWGELAELRVRCWDSARKRLSVEKSKNHEARSVPVPDRVAELLDALAKDRPRDARLFTSPRGAAINGRNFRDRYYDAAAGRIGFPDLDVHSLRHTAASLAIAAGANVKVVQRMLGHKSAKMTMDRYGHLFDTDLDDVATRLSAAAAAADVPQKCPDSSADPPGGGGEGSESVAAE